MGKCLCSAVMGVTAALIGLGWLSNSSHSKAADAQPAGDVYKPILPETVFTQLVTEETKSLKEAIAKADDKKVAVKARSLAFMIAVYAQDEVARGGPKAAAMAGLRDNALNVAKAIGDKKLDEAKKLVDQIQPAGVAGSSAKVGPNPVHDEFDVDTLMQVFRRDRSAGLEWELKLNKFVEKRGTYTASEYQQMIPLLYRIAAVAQPTEAFAPTTPMGKKTPAEWIRLSKEMGAEAIATAELAKKPKPDDKMVKASIKKLDATCIKCHEVFRDAK